MLEKLLAFNENIQYAFNENIVEYDIKTASLSISDRYNLLDKDLIEELRLLPKEKYTRRIGCLQRDDKVFSQRLISGIIEMRSKFITHNNIDESSIISVHSDAIFITSKKRIKCDIEGVEFVKKNSWTSYMRFGKIEMFYNDGVITYKNVPKEMMSLHTVGIHQYLCKIFDKIENYDSTIFKYMRTFQKQYFHDKLPEYMYIPFGKNGAYKTYNMELFAFIANVVINESRKF